MPRDMNKQEKLKQALDRTMIKYSDTFRRLADSEREETSKVDPFEMKVDEPVAAEAPNTVVTSSASTQDLIRRVCDEVKEMLVAKNIAYGDSALNPVRVFSRCSPEEQLRVRIDDKLSRLARGSAAGEDVVNDLIGYLVLLKVHMLREKL